MVITNLKQLYVLMWILLLINSPPEMQGRVMGVRAFAIFPLFLGNMIAGALAQIIGAPLTILILSAPFSLSMLILTRWTPELRKLE